MNHDCVGDISVLLHNILHCSEKVYEEALYNQGESKYAKQETPNQQRYSTSKAKLHSSSSLTPVPIPPFEALISNPITPFEPHIFLKPPRAPSFLFVNHPLSNSNRFTPPDPLGNTNPPETFVIQRSSCCFPSPCISDGFL